MDNFQIDITAEGTDSLKAALSIAFAHNAPGGTASHYRTVTLEYTVEYYANLLRGNMKANVETDPPLHVHHLGREKKSESGVEALILLWSDESHLGAIKLAFPHTVDDAFAFVKGWMRTADPGRKPDIDGDTGSGWRVFTESWGHVADSTYSIVAVQPAWALYGK